MTHLRILVLCSAFPPTSGGAESYIDVLSAGLARRGHDLLVMTDHIPGVPPVQPGQRSIRRLSGYRDLLADPSKVRWEQMSFALLTDIADHLGDWRPDVVLANNYETTILARMVADHLTIPLVGSYHEHAPETEPFGEGKMALAYHRLAPDAVLAGSTYYERRALRYLGADRVHLIYHGVDTEAFHPGVDGSKIRAQYGVPDHATLLVTVGRLKERKGQHPLIRAIAALADPHLHLVIAGSVSSASTAYAESLETLIRDRGLTARVTVDQSVTHADVPALLSAADIVVQPSLSEGLGLALLEAMSAGRATVATRIAGFSEIFAAGTRPWPELAELVDPDDVDSLAAGIRTLCDDPDRRARLGGAGRDHVLAHFSQQGMIAATEQVLTTVVNRGAGAG